MHGVKQSCYACVTVGLCAYLTRRLKANNSRQLYISLGHNIGAVSENLSRRRNYYHSTTLLFYFNKYSATILLFVALLFYCSSSKIR